LPQEGANHSDSGKVTAHYRLSYRQQSECMAIVQMIDSCKCHHHRRHHHHLFFSWTTAYKTRIFGNCNNTISNSSIVLVFDYRIQMGRVG